MPKKLNLLVQSPRNSALLWMAYVAIVLSIDLASHLRIDFLVEWKSFAWRSANGFDFYKFIAWFIVPFGLVAYRFDPSYWTWKRWKRSDALLLTGLAVAAFSAVLLVLFIPELKQTYLRSTMRDPAQLALRSLIWTISWIVGWEFLFRYVLLFRLSAVWPRLGWLFVPAFEVAYHYRKSNLEILGVAVFSAIACLWALKRRNALLPFLVHLMIEVELIGLVYCSRLFS